MYLGAGNSRRMGYPKLSVRLEEQGGNHDSLGGYGLRSALESRIRPIIAVTKPGPIPDWLSKSDARRGNIHVAAEEAELGMAHSIRAGLTEAMEYVPKAVIIQLADQPLVTSKMLERLVTRWEIEPELDYTAYWKDGASTPPALLAASMFPSLLKLSGDEGARKLLLEPRFKGAFLQAEQESWLMDVDTEEDLDLLLRERKKLTVKEKEGQR